ncbi:MAG: hypothetical protein FD180_3224 [Planctomycetota bacterium]|nr:MAG: hypothetical protein FD180_3224 [Planctomycetota bacterium]
MLRPHPAPTEAQITADALRLPPAAAVKLASKLLARVEQEGDRNAKAAFRATLLRRRQEMRSGKVKGMTVEQCMRALERQAAKRR